MGTGNDFPIETRVASTRQDKTQLNENDSAKTSVRVSVMLLTHVLVGPLTPVFTTFIPVDISVLQSDPLMRSLGDRSSVIRSCQAHHQDILLRAGIGGMPLHPNTNLGDRVRRTFLENRPSTPAERIGHPLFLAKGVWHRRLDDCLGIALGVTNPVREVSTRQENFLSSVRVAAIFSFNLSGCHALNCTVFAGTRGDGDKEVAIRLSRSAAKLTLRYPMSGNLIECK